MGTAKRTEDRGQRAEGKGNGSRAACIVYRLQQLVVAVAASAIASDPLILFGVKGLGCATPTAGVCGRWAGGVARTARIGSSECWATFLIKTLLQQLIYSLLLRRRRRRRRLAFDL